MFGRAGKAGSPAGKDGRGLSFIGPEAMVSGDVASGAQLHLDGRVDGDVRCAGLIQGAGGTIAGNVAAEQARIAGLVEGRVEAHTLIVEATARICGDIFYETLSVAPGARIEGRLSRIGEAPAPAEAPLKLHRGPAPAEEPPLIAIAGAPRAASG
jgi:cytoskeletal protein CcmA (bactofilin family)